MKKTIIILAVLGLFTGHTAYAAVYNDDKPGTHIVDGKQVRGYVGSTNLVGQTVGGYVIAEKRPKGKIDAGNFEVRNILRRLLESDRPDFIEMVKRAGIRYE